MTNLRPFSEFVDQFERAARNGTKAHVPPSIVRAVVSHPAWRDFMAERQKELVSTWQDNVPPQPEMTTAHESNSGRSGSSGALSGSNGASLGTITAAQSEAVVSAERRQALSILAGMENRRKRRKTP